MTKKVPPRWRLFRSGSTTSKCTGLTSSKVSDTAPGWSFQGHTLRPDVCAKQQPTNKPHTKSTWKSFVILHEGGVSYLYCKPDANPDLPCRRQWERSVLC